jgi:hypothetical protein
MGAGVNFPTLTDVLFPETQRLARQRRAHWRHCDFALHYRARAWLVGVPKVAAQMRRQGFGLDTTLSVLTRKP